MTERGVALLTNVARLRLASAAQLGTLDGGSHQKVERTLLALWENGYLERPEAQVAYRRAHAGSHSLVYGLTRKGARFLREQGFDMDRALLDGIDKDKGAGWRFIQHSIGISDFFVRLEIAARGREEEVRILEKADILKDAADGASQRIHLQARIALGQTQRTCGVMPDGFFGLHFLSDQTEAYFMYEKDRGEMPITRYKNMYGTYVSKKLLTYYEVSRQRRHVSELGIPNFRVLVETTTAERVEQMIKAVEEFTGGQGSNIFLFADERSLADSNPLDYEWSSGKRQAVNLLR
jgi:Replication-relaxation